MGVNESNCDFMREKKKRTLAVWIPASMGPPAVLALVTFCGHIPTEHRTQD